METVIYLIRHSESASKKESYGKDSILLPLSENGRVLARKLSDLDILSNIDLLYSSNYTRALETAEYISNKNKINININDLLGERKLGVLEDKDIWSTQLVDCNFKFVNGESRKDVEQRMDKAIKEILLNKGKRVALVSHASAITFYLMKYCDLISFDINGKKRHLNYKNKEIINGIFRTPEIFELKFVNDSLIDINRIDYSF